MLQLATVALGRERKLFNTILTNVRNSSKKKKDCSGRPIDRCEYREEEPKSIVPIVELNNGIKMPILGLGTWGGTWPKKKEDGTLENNDEVKLRVKSEKVKKVIQKAIDIGYRHIDGAQVYHNEKEVGEAVRKKIREGVICREDMFMVSKLWNTYHSPELVRKACEDQITNMDLGYIDLYLIHFPVAYQAGCELFPVDGCGHIVHSNVDYVDTWKEMEKLVADGLVKSIGVSNFNMRQIKRILDVACIPPVVNQVECHPYLNQRRLLDFLKKHNIVLTAYSPLGSPHRSWASNEKFDPSGLMKDKMVVEIAQKHKKHPAQILIRYHIQRGNIVIPRAKNKNEAKINFDVFFFELSDADMAVLSNMNRPARAFFWESDCRHEHYPFSDPY